MKFEFNPNPTKQIIDVLFPVRNLVKAKKNPGIIKHLSILLLHKTLDKMYKALVRSHLDYRDIIYHMPSRQTQLDVILNVLMETEMIQFSAALAVTVTWQGSYRFNFYEALEWESWTSLVYARSINI